MSTLTLTVSRWPIFAIRALPSKLQKAEFSMSRSRKWRTKNIASRLEARANARMQKEVQQMDYSGWSHEDLIKRVTDLELELKQKNASCVAPNITMIPS